MEWDSVLENARLLHTGLTRGSSSSSGSATLGQVQRIISLDDTEVEFLQDGHTARMIECASVAIPSLLRRPDSTAQVAGASKPCEFFHEPDPIVKKRYCPNTCQNALTVS
jgi:hypothetical protein